MGIYGVPRTTLEREDKSELDRLRKLTPYVQTFQLTERREAGPLTWLAGRLWLAGGWALASYSVRLAATSYCLELRCTCSGLG